MTSSEHRKMQFMRLMALCFAVLGLLVPPASADDVRWEKTPAIADMPVLNQDGQHLRFYADVVKGKTVVMGFIYTRCLNECPVITAVLRRTQMKLAQELRSNVQFVAVSVDPVNDKPEELKKFAEKFDANGNWTFVTGEKPDIDRILKSLGAFAPDNKQHLPMILVGNEPAGQWTRAFGIPKSDSIASLIVAAATPVRKTSLQSLPTRDAANYFTNLPLIDQDGKAVRFYHDLIENKIVVINTIFTHCTMICSPMTQNLAKAQQFLKPEVVDKVHLISISVDPENDPPQALKEFAAGFHANRNWTFLTGKKENIDWILYKLGAHAERREDHFSLLIVGNEAGGKWSKLLALAKPEEIAAAIAEVAAAPND